MMPHMPQIRYLIRDAIDRDGGQVLGCMTKSPKAKGVPAIGLCSLTSPEDRD